MMKRTLHRFSLLLFAAAVSDALENEEPQVYWPIQGYETNDHDQADVYSDYLNGCLQAHSEDACIQAERRRISQNHRLPALQLNSTETGYTVVQAPMRVDEHLSSFFPNTRHFNKSETWDIGSNINHWACETQKIDFNLVPDGKMVVDELQKMAEQWSGETLQLTLVDGIRIFHNGCVQAPHVFEPPLIISVLLNVAQNTDDPTWRMQVIGHDGKPSYVRLRPGEMLIYECHSVIVGHTEPFQGEFVALLSLHFDVPGYSEWYESLQRTSPEQVFASALNHPVERHSRGGLPYYIPPSTVEAKRWNQEFVFSRDPAVEKPAKKKYDRTTGVTSAHILAAVGDLERLKLVAEKDPASLNEADSNGWKPIHEAARAGNTEVLEFLIKDHSIPVNERTNNGSGASPLWWAEHELDEGHETIVLLRENGGRVIAPNANDVEAAR